MFVIVFVAFVSFWHVQRHSQIAYEFRRARPSLITIYLFIISFLFRISRQTIPLVILEEGSYEKDVLLYVNIGEPQMVGGKNEQFIYGGFIMCRRFKRNS